MKKIVHTKLPKRKLVLLLLLKFIFATENNARIFRPGSRERRQ